MMMVAIWVWLRRKSKLWTVFEVSFLFELLSLLAQAGTFVIIGTAIPADSALSVGFGGLYVESVVLGIILMTFMEVSIVSPYSSLNDAYWNRRLEPLLMAPTPFIVIIIADALWSYGLGVFKALVYVLILVALGVGLNPPSDVLIPSVATLIGLSALFGIGLISASTFSLLNAKGWHDPVKWFFLTFQGLMAGIYFPISLIPSTFRAISYTLPQTYIVDTVRRTFIAGYQYNVPLVQIGPLSAHASNLVLVSVLAVVYVSIGLGLYCHSMRKHQYDGNLSL